MEAADFVELGLESVVFGLELLHAGGEVGHCFVRGVNAVLDFGEAFAEFFDYFGLHSGEGLDVSSRGGVKREKIEPRNSRKIEWQADQGTAE